MEDLPQLTVRISFSTKAYKSDGEEVEIELEKDAVITPYLRVNNNGGYTYTGTYKDKNGIEYEVIISYKDINDGLVQRIEGGGRKRRKSRKSRKPKRRYTRKN